MVVGRWCFNRYVNQSLLCNKKVALVRTVPSMFDGPPKEFPFRRYGPFCNIEYMYDIVENPILYGIEASKVQILGVTTPRQL